MDYAISELAQNYGTTNGISVAAYSSLYGLKNKFNVSASKFGKFMEKYSELAYEDERLDEGDGIPPTGLNIGELIEGRTTLPLIGNFVFKFHVEEGEEERGYYGEDLPLRIIKCYQKAMTELLNISDISEFVCCVLEGHSYRRGDVVKKNLMIHFPFCQLDIKFTRKTFKSYVEKLLRKEQVINAFETQPIGDWNDHMVDFVEAVPMYRSSMEQHTPHLSLTHVYYIVEDTHIEQSVGPEVSLKMIFKPSSHSFIHTGKIPVTSLPLKADEDEDEEEFCKYWLPLFLSIHFWSGQTIPKETEKEEAANVKKGFYDVDEMDSDNPIHMAQSLLPLLSVERVNKDWSWLDLGRVLYNVYRGTEEGLNAWISISSRATVPGRDKNMCTYKYPEFKNNLLTVATLAWYAKQDNPEGYADWHTNWCQKTLNDSTNATHADVAKAIYRIFWLEYVYSSDSGIWYQYRGNHFYRIGKEPIPLRREILGRFIFIYEKMRLNLTNESVSNRALNEETKNNIEFKLKAINALIMKIKNENYRSTIVKATKDFFHVEEFEKKCDKNHFLTSLSNCVLEVVDKRVRARPGKPEDFILKYSNLHYPFEYTWDSYWVKEVMNWFDMITVRNRDLKHYFLKRIASFLRGQNPEKLFDVWTNEGNGGKSKLTETLQFMYGSYFVDFPVSLLATGNGKNSSGPTPELAQAMDARCAILSEPDDRVALGGGIIKRLTGGDRIFTRFLNDNGGSMQLTFKTIMICNRIPDIANVDKALINRFVIIPFLGIWANDDVPENIEDQFKIGRFKIDPFFDAKIPELAKALMWVSVQYYQYYASEGLEFPTIVKEYIKKHWEDNDFYLQFIAEKIEYAYVDGDKKEVDTNVTLAANDIYPFFSRWFKDFYPGMQTPTASQFKADMQMSGRLGPQPKRGVWLGIKLKSITPDLGGGVKI